MTDIWTTVVGNIAGPVNKRRLPDGTELASFRVASNERRLDRTSGTWTTAGTSYVTVTAWRRLGQHVVATFVKGDPVVVYGRLSTREYEDKTGAPRIDVGIEAQAVGPDLSWCTAAITRIRTRTNGAEADAHEVAAEAVPPEPGEDPADSLACVDSEEPGFDGDWRTNGRLVGAVPGDGA